MECRLDSLHSEWALLGERLKESRRLIRSVSRKVRVARRAAARAWALTPCMERTALSIYVLTDYSLQPAIVFLKSLGRRHRWPPQSDGELGRRVEDSFLRADPDMLIALVDASQPLDQAVFEASMRYVREWRVVSWGFDMNCVKGFAPATSMVLRRAAAERMVLPASTVVPRQGMTMSAATRKWASRWRRKWHARIGKLRPRERISEGESRAKVTTFFCW